MSTRQERLNGKSENSEVVTDFLSEMNEPVEVTAPVEETIPQSLQNQNNRTGLYFESNEEFNSIFERMEQSTPEEVTGDILTHKIMEIGVPYNFIWTGYGTIEDKVSGEMRKSIKLVNKDKETFYCASMVVMTAFEKIEENFPVPVRLISLGMKQGKKNDYWNVKVFQL